MPATDPAATKEEDTFFTESEQHSLSVRRWAAGISLGLICALYVAGLVLLIATAVFSGTLCAPNEQAMAKEFVQTSSTPRAMDAGIASMAANGDAKAKANTSATASKVEAKAASDAEEAAHERGPSQSCANALALLNSHAMVGALIALFSIPTVLLIVLMRAFASSKKEKAVPDTAISWLADKLAAGIEKLTGGKD